MKQTPTATKEVAPALEIGSWGGTAVGKTAVGAAEAPDLFRGPPLTVGVGGTGHAIVVQWDIARGATDVELDPNAASIRIAPRPLLASIGALALAADGNLRRYANPSRQRIRSLTLAELKGAMNGDPVYASAGDFAHAAGAGQLRLVVSTRASSSEPWIPVFAVPSVPGSGVVPSMLSGATFAGSVLSFPYAVTGELRFGLYTGSAPQNFEPVPFKVASASAAVEVLPVDLALTGPDGGTIWAFPGPFLATSPAATASLRVPVELALQADLPRATKEKRPLRAEIRLQGKAASAEATVSFAPPRGAVVRREPSLLHCDLAGDPVPLPMAEDPDPQAPTSVTGALSVRYLGLRLHADLSDPAPAPDEPVRGVVVRSAPVRCVFPPAGLIGLSVGKAGIVGRAPEDCELEAQIVRLEPDGTVSPLGPPGRLAMPPSDVLGTAWIDMPMLDPSPDPLALTLRAVRGRYFWAGGGQARHRVRVVVRDADPGGRPVCLGGTVLATVGLGADGRTAVDLPNVSFPPSLFRAAAPRLESELFVGVDIADLTLRYARP